MFSNLTEDNYLGYAMKAYDRPVYTSQEFSEDIKRFHYLNRLFHRYTKHSDLRERLILNHIVILKNVFGSYAVIRLLFLKVREKYYPILKTFLLYLNIMQDVVEGIRGSDIPSSTIQVDYQVVQTLRKLHE